MTGADGVAVARLAVDLTAGVALDGIIANQGDAAVRDEVLQDEATE
jgi:hypothetical protein